MTRNKTRHALRRWEGPTWWTHTGPRYWDYSPRQALVSRYLNWEHEIGGRAAIRLATEEDRPAWPWTPRAETVNEALDRIGEALAAD